MKNIIIKVIIFLLVINSFAAETGIGKKPFSIIILPDTQNYLKNKDAQKKFSAQTEWINNNLKKLNIKFVIHEGDITDNNSPEQWKLARKYMGILDGNVPYAVCVGNHDIGYEGPEKSPICGYFKVSDYKEEPWWGGKMENENCFWYKFNAGGDKYLVLSLNFGPSDKMLKWADKIIKENPNRNILMVTHAYIHDNGEFSNSKSEKNASFYGRHFSGDKRNTADMVWEKHVSKHKNYLMVFSGHFRGPSALLSKKGNAGNIVHQMLSNYQYEDGGGNGFLRILQFNPTAKTCKVSTYSPYLDKHLRGNEDEFILKL
jgi:hypothetical protein